MADRAYLEKLTKQLTDQGRLIEAGWIGLRRAAIADNAPPVQLEEMRMSFFAGARHLFDAMMAIMDPGTEPTANDLRRMDLIHHELEAFHEWFKKEAAERMSKKDAGAKLGDQEIEPQYHEKMNAVAATLDEFFNGENAAPGKRKTGFVLLVFEFGPEPGRCNFISNGADRRDVVTLFKEMIARFEGQPEMKGHA